MHIACLSYTGQESKKEKNAVHVFNTYVTLKQCQGHWTWYEPVKADTCMHTRTHARMHTHTHPHTRSHTHHTHLECIFSLRPRIDTHIPSWSAVICLPQSGPRTSQFSQRSSRWSVKQFQVNTITPWTSNATLTWTLNQPVDLGSSLECSDPDKLWLITLSLLALIVSSEHTGAEAKYLWCSEFHVRTAFSYSNLHDMTNSVPEILSQLRCNCCQCTTPA